MPSQFENGCTGLAYSGSLAVFLKQTSHGVGELRIFLGSSNLNLNLIPFTLLHNFYFQIMFANCKAGF